jgi:hypothetical protein
VFHAVFQPCYPHYVFGPKRDEVTGEKRKLHNDELNDLYRSPNIVRVKKREKNVMGGACSSYGEGRGVYTILVAKPEGKSPLGRPRHRWEDNIQMDLQEVVREGYGLDWAGSG